MAIPNTPIPAPARKRRYSQADARDLTQAELKRRLHYDPETGIFMWRVTHKHRLGKEAGSLRSGSIAKSGARYRIINIRGVLYRANRLAWLYMTGAWPLTDVDHKDTDRANNRWSNLRLATRSENNVNTTRRPLGASGIRGVIFDPRYKLPWKAAASVQNRTVVLGRFATSEAAAQAREAFAKNHYGEFARFE